MRRAWLAALLALCGCAAAGAAVRREGRETTFRYRGPGEQVWLTGTMTDWRPVPLAREGAGWSLRVPLPPGRHEYRLEVREGGTVHPVWPPGAERADDGFGGENGILRVER